MKKMMLTLVALLAVTLQANALSKSRSREEARFLTDKMAYELDLTDEQLQDIYEINYDYFRSLGPVTGSYEMYYDRRYNDLSYVLYDWQWREFLLREYFLRPAYIYRGGWAFGVYNYYARTHFFFGVPHVYHTYRGGHYRHPNYYLGRREMHHHAVAARPRPNLHDRRPMMTRPNAGQHFNNGSRPGPNVRKNNAPKQHSPAPKGNNNVRKDNGVKQNGPAKKSENMNRPNNPPTRNGNAGRNNNVTRTPSNSNPATRGNVNRSTNTTTRSSVTRSNSGGTTRSGVTRSSGAGSSRSSGQSSRSSNDGGRSRR